VSFGNWRAAQPSSPAELGCIKSKAAEVEREGSESGKLKLIPSLGLEQGLSARTAGSAVSKADQDLLRHARGQDAFVDLRPNVLGETHNHTPAEHECTTEGNRVQREALPGLSMLCDLSMAR
jgi:hypothetical protein